jgi:hypothetical protein
MKSQSTNSKRSGNLTWQELAGNTTWQEAAANRLESKKTRKPTTTTKAKVYSKEEEEEIDSSLSNDGPSLSELEAELENLMKKIETENKSIEEVKAVNASSRNYRSVIAHAKREKNTDNNNNNNEATFFITSVDAGGHGGNEKEEEINKIPKEKYPNYQKELILAKEATKEQKKMAKLELKASKLQNDNTKSMISKSGIKTKSKYGELKNQKSHKKENSSMETLLPSINVKK